MTRLRLALTLVGLLIALEALFLAGDAVPRVVRSRSFPPGVSVTGAITSPELSDLRRVTDPLSGAVNLSLEVPQRLARPGPVVVVVPADIAGTLAPGVLAGGTGQPAIRPTQSYTRSAGSTRVRLVMPTLRRVPAIVANAGIVNIEFLPWRAWLLLALLALAAAGGFGAIWKASRASSGRWGMSPARVAAVAVPAGLVTFGLTRLASSPEYSASYLLTLVWYGFAIALAGRLAGPRGAMATTGVAGLGLLAADPADAAFWVVLWATYGLVAGGVLLRGGDRATKAGYWALAAAVAAPIIVGFSDVAILEHVMGLLPADPRAEVLTHCPAVVLHCHTPSAAPLPLAVGAGLGLGAAAVASALTGQDRRTRLRGQARPTRDRTEGCWRGAAPLA